MINTRKVKFDKRTGYGKDLNIGNPARDAGGYLSSIHNVFIPCR